MRIFLVGIAIAICFGLFLGCGNAAEIENTSVVTKSNIEAKKQAETYYEKAMEAYEQKNYIVAVDQLEKGLDTISLSNDAALAMSSIFVQLYRNLIVMYNQTGVALLQKGLLDENTAQYFDKSLNMIQKLDQDQSNLKKEIDSSLSMAGGLDHYRADAYYSLGIIYGALQKKDLKDEYVRKLRSLGRNDWADEVERGNKSN